MNGHQRHSLQLNDQIISKLNFVHDVSHILKILQIHQNTNALPKMQFIFKEHSINEHNILYA